MQCDGNEAALSGRTSALTAWFDRQALSSYSTEWLASLLFCQKIAYFDDTSVMHVSVTSQFINSGTIAATSPAIALLESIALASPPFVVRIHVKSTFCVLEALATCKVWIPESKFEIRRIGANCHSQKKISHTCR